MNTPYKFKLKFPSDLDYIPPIRKFIAETLTVTQFTPKFAYRSEVIVDEICHNAIVHGSRSLNAEIELECEIYPDKFEFRVKDEGGKKEDLEKLKSVVKKSDVSALGLSEGNENRGLGLEIVRLLSEEIDMEIGENNKTTVRVVRKREDF
jgi:anti-sigma regulatory factor (Ser/Thr protein kinase)